MDNIKATIVSFLQLPAMGAIFAIMQIMTAWAMKWGIDRQQVTWQLVVYFLTPLTFEALMLWWASSWGDKAGRLIFGLNLASFILILGLAYFLGWLPL